MEQNKKCINCPSIGDYAPYLDGSEEFGEKVETVNIGFAPRHLITV